MDFGLILLQAFWFIAPAYAANGFPPLMRGKMPIDGRKNFGRHRLFGDGKTWEGLIGGIVFGVFIGSVQLLGQDYLPKEWGLAYMSLPIVFALSIGTMGGDLIGSFIKRRLGMKRGSSALFMDQLGFLITALLLASPFYILGIYHIIILIVLTPIIHWMANVFGFWIKVKRNPW